MVVETPYQSSGDLPINELDCQLIDNVEEIESRFANV